jgi:prolyl oligopeptidase
MNLAPRGDTSDNYLSKDGNISVSDPYRFMEDVESE